MKLKGKLLVLLMFVMITFSAKSQQISDSLSTDSEVFFQQLSDILMGTPSKTWQDKSEVLLERFYASWSVGRFNKNEKSEVRHLVEKMRSKKMRAIPNLYNYIYSLTLLAESHQNPKSIIAWHQYASTLLDEKNTKSFLLFLTYSNRLFENNIVYKKKSSFAWYYRNGRFKLSYDSVFKVTFERLNLVCATKRDSSIIEKTSGFFNYNTKKWSGNSGRITWQRFGEEEAEDIQAEFDHYSIQLEKNTFVVDSARLFYPRFFKNPILGQLTERILSSPPNDNSVYPSFFAYEEGIDMGEVYPNLNLVCNLKLEGKTLYGVGSEWEKAMVTVKLRDEVYARFMSDKFRLKDKVLESGHTEFIFYLEGDSIYHPDLKLRYKSEKNELVLFSSLFNTSDHIPFYDSYHKLDIDVPALYWSMTEDKIYFKKFKQLRGANIASFESSNYFSLKEFYSLQVMDLKNPLYVVDNYLKKYESDGGRVIEVPLMADYMGVPQEQVVALLVDLSNRGFIVYNAKQRTAVVKNKLFYYLFAKSGQTDFDVIHFVSKVNNRPNAVIDLNTLDLDIYGVPRVSISDSQSVYIYPYGQTISVKKNRDFSFDGKVQVGLFDFSAHNSMFVYDSFMLNLNYIDTMAFYLMERDTMNARKVSFKRVKNVVTQMNGKIYIDDPNNKSGRNKFAEYPIFISKDDSYVYFNRRDIQDSTLAPDRFYYKVEPFVFDSVSEFNTTGLSFKGSLYADGIIPEIEEPITIMSDRSMGFVHQIPDTGYAIYNGKARYYGVMRLDGNGFSGEGRVEYLDAAFDAPDLVFYPDSLKGTARNLFASGDEIKYNTPAVKGDSLKMDWNVVDNVMKISNQDTAKLITLYKNSKLDGFLCLNPEFMHGKGVFTFDRSEVVSNAMEFTFNTMSADSADFTLYDESHEQEVFISKGYYAHIDFKREIGEFDNLYEGAFVELPFNKYITTLDQVKWRMSERKLELSSGDNDDFYQKLDSLSDYDVINSIQSGPEFISIEPSQDSLRFYAKRGLYDMNYNTINVEGVRFIKTGDAAVFPRNGDVRLYEGARMDTLYQASIITDTVDKYHRIYDAEVHIHSRNKFDAEGFLDYVDMNDLPQQIFMPKIETDQWGRTVAEGKVANDEFFFLSPVYFFKGDITMVSTEPYLKFSGGYRLNEECIGQEDNWVAFSRSINPKHVQFVIDTTTATTDSIRARFGLALSPQRHNFYPMVLQQKESPYDIVTIECYGKMEYDTAHNTFRVGNELRLRGDENVGGNYIQLDNQRCILSGDGILDLGTNFTQTKFTTAGKFKHLIIPDSTFFETSLIFDFYFDDKALGMMADSLRMIPGNVVDVEHSPFNIAIHNLLNKEDAVELRQALSLYGNIKKMPKQIQGAVIFSDLNLVWDYETRSYISQGPIGVGFVAGHAVNKLLNGYLQVEVGRGGSAIHFYLETARNTWYFFSYQNGIMQTISSDMNYNERIAGIKDVKRMKNPDSEEEYYEYVISTKRKMIDFVRRMERIEKRAN